MSNTLKNISNASKFNYWMYSQMRPFLNGKILEIGSGIGNISQFIIRDFPTTYLSDTNETYIKSLEQRFSTNKVMQINLVHPDFDIVYNHLFNSFDFVIALNVIEHIENDSLAVNNLAKFVKFGGKFYILVPSYQCLFNTFDVGLGHYRRYNKHKLKKLCPSKCKIINIKYFNALGLIGWFLLGSIFKFKIIPKNSIDLYNKIILLGKITDLLVLNTVGLSLTLLVEKNNTI